MNYVTVTLQVIDDWRYVSLVMDRFLMYVYMIVTVVATCSILIRTSVFASFDQETFRYQIEHERSCKDDIPYNNTCDDWYTEICPDEHNPTEIDPIIVANPGYHMLKACMCYMDKVQGREITDYCRELGATK